MKLLKIGEVSLVINHISALNIHKEGSYKDHEGKEIPCKAKISVLMGNTNLTFDYDNDELARKAYDTVVEALGAHI